MKQAASFNEAESQFQQEVSHYNDNQLQQSLAAQAQGVEAPPTSLLKLRLLRDEVNRDALGHASLETTNRYAHGTEDGKRRAVEAQEQYLQRSGHKTVTKIKRQAG